MRSRSAVVSAIAFLAVVAAPAASGDPPPAFALKTLVSGLEQPTSFAFAPDGRIYIAEKRGVVKVFNRGRVRVFVDLSSRVNAAAERGLLALALDPGFASNRRLYVLFTEELHPDTPDGPTPAGGVLLRLEVSSVDPDRPEPRSERTLLSGYDSYGIWHSVGGMDFDARGRIVLGLGDGQRYYPHGIGRQAEVALDLNSLNGKILRIDPENGRGVPDNPFFDPTRPTSVRSRVLAYGVRTPFRVRVDPATGRIYVGDVGTSAWEEINVVPPSVRDADRDLNFGWPCYEGGRTKLAPLRHMAGLPQCLVLYRQKRGGAAPPHYAYPGLGAAAVVVGPVYRDRAYPDRYRGRLFFADFIRDVVCTYDGARAASFGTGNWGSAVDIQATPAGTLAYAAFRLGELREITYGGAPDREQGEGEEERPCPLAAALRPERSLASSVAAAAGGLGILLAALAAFAWQGIARRRGGVPPPEQKGASMPGNGSAEGEATESETARARALVQLERRRDFRLHVWLYVAWSFFLGIVWMVSEHERTGAWPTLLTDNPAVLNWSLWIAYPIAGWGLVLAFHAFVTYRRPLTARAVEEEMRRLDGRA